MILVREINGVWQAATGVHTFTIAADTREVTYADGRVEVEACEPYPIAVQLDLGKVERLVAEGVWTQEDLDPYGLRIAVPFEAPEGKQAVGVPSYIEADGVVREVYAVEDIPPPPPPPTALEKLAAAGLTIDEFDQLVAESSMRQGGR